MFIHFGMSAYDGQELSACDKLSTHYNPTRLDVGQSVSVARDARMKHAVLTAKHVAGHCLWPARLNDYHVCPKGPKARSRSQFSHPARHRRATGMCGRNRNQSRVDPRSLLYSLRTRL